MGERMPALCALGSDWMHSSPRETNEINPLSRWQQSDRSAEIKRDCEVIWVTAAISRVMKPSTTRSTKVNDPSQSCKPDRFRSCGKTPSLLTCLLSDAFKFQISTCKATFHSPVTKAAFTWDLCDAVIGFVFL